MLVVVTFVIAALTVPIAGGRFRGLVELRFRATWALASSAGTQAIIWYLATKTGTGAFTLGALHLLSYGFAGWFLLRNHHIPGLWLVGLGGLMNLAAIASNGGVMPASAAAWAFAGLPPAEAFSNSAITHGARLALLGDVFALPAGWPLANVFSIGDVLIAFGGAIVLHRVCGSRLLPSGSDQFASLLPHRQFVRLWGAQAVSHLGDWTYSLAVAASMAGRGEAAKILAALLIAQVGPAAFLGLLGGPLVDRVNRKVVMAGADVARAVAVGSLFVVGTPTLAHYYAVAAVLGLAGAVFAPAMHASLPNLVPASKLVAANALVSGTQHVAIMVGPVLGGVLVTTVGASTAFGVNAASFLLSAALLLRLRLPRAGAPPRPGTAVADLVEGLRYAGTTPLIRGVLIALSVIVLGAAIRSPLEPVFVLDTLGADTTTFGLLSASWGFGMVLGSVAAPAAARRWARERILSGAVLLVGLAVLAASRVEVAAPIMLIWLFAGAGNAVGSISYETLLQERTPDRLRGRVMAAAETVTYAALLIGASVAGLISGVLGTRGAFALSGFVFVAAAAIVLVLVKVQGSPGLANASGVAPRGPLALVAVSDLGSAARLSGALQRAGYLVARAADLDEAEVALATFEPAELILTDATLLPAFAPERVSGLSGSGRWDGARVLALLPPGAAGDAAACRAVGAHDVLVGPLSAAALLAAVDSAAGEPAIAAAAPVAG